MKFKCPLLISILVITLSYSCTKPKPVVKNLEAMTNLVTQNELDKFFASIGYKWVGEDLNNDDVYFEKSNKNLVNVQDTLDMYKISRDTLSKTFVFQTTNVDRYLTAIDEAKVNGYEMVKRDPSDLLNLIIGDSYKSNKFIIYCKKDKDFDQVVYTISLMKN